MKRSMRAFALGTVALATVLLLVVGAWAWPTNITTRKKAEKENTQPESYHRRVKKLGGDPRRPMKGTGNARRGLGGGGNFEPKHPYSSRSFSSDNEDNPYSLKALRESARRAQETAAAQATYQAPTPVSTNQVTDTNATNDVSGAEVGVPAIDAPAVK